MASTIAVDVAKSVFEVAVSEHPGRVRERRRLSRSQFSRFVAQRPPATIGELERRLRAVERQLEVLAAESAVVTRLRTTPGIGLLTATALFAFVGDVSRFPSGRHFASYLGLTPRESSSGLRRRLGRISKRGDTYLRMLLIHGARAVLWHAKRLRRPGRLRIWALRLERQRGHNKAAVALANKLARVAWAVWRHGAVFDDHVPAETEARG